MQGLFDFARLGNLGGPQANAGPPIDQKMNDTAEQIISKAKEVFNTAKEYKEL